MSFLVTAVTTDNEVRTAMVSREAMYETIKEIVGGLIQPVRLPIPTEVLGTKKVEVYMYVNEEGILENLLVMLWLRLLLKQHFNLIWMTQLWKFNRLWGMQCL